MGEQQNKSLEEAVQSYALWWRDAGFETATDELAHGWRDPPTPFWRREAAVSRATAAPVQAPAMQGRPAIDVDKPAPRQTRIPSEEMPDSLPAFLEWVAQDASQPEAGWDGAPILPPARQDGRLILIVEMPALDASDKDSLLEPGQRRFLDAMVASLGVAPEDAALVTMACRRPPGGLLDEATLTRLAARMLHYLKLARPKSAIILGDRTSRALLGAQWSPRAGALPAINHQAGTMSTVALASAELLMSRPMAKAKSWQALRLLHGNLNA